MTKTILCFVKHTPQEETFQIKFMKHKFHKLCHEHTYIVRRAALIFGFFFNSRKTDVTLDQYRQK